MYNLYIHPSSLPAVGCGYYFIITKGAMSHTAFRTKKALNTWLSQTGLKIGKRRNGRSVNLLGDYQRKSVMMDTKTFYNTYGHLEQFYVLDNGNYTIGFIDRSGIENVLYLQNCNMDRPILDYRKVTIHLETGKPLNRVIL